MSETVELVISSGLGGMNWGFAFLIIAIDRFAKGTRVRYVLTTLAWPLVPFMMFQPIWFTMTEASFWVRAVNLIGNFCCIYYLFKNDDDNYWRRKKKGLKRWVANLSRRPVAVGAKA